MSGNSEAPFSLEGDLFHSVEWDGEQWVGPNDSRVEWRTVEKEFEARMCLDSFSKNRSVYTFRWKDDQGRMYPMSLHEMLSVLMHMERGTVQGIWTVVRRGNRYSLKLLYVEEPEEEGVAEPGWEPTQVVWDDTGRVSKASIIPATIGVGAVLWVVSWLIHRSRK